MRVRKWGWKSMDVGGRESPSGGGSGINGEGRNLEDTMGGDFNGHVQGFP